MWPFDKKQAQSTINGNLRQEPAFNANSRIRNNNRSSMFGLGLLNRDKCGANGSDLIRLSEELGYPEVITYYDLRWMYYHNGLAKRVCEILPQFCWSPAPVIVEGDNKGEQLNTPFERAVKEIFEKIDFITYLHRADICAQIGQYGAMYVDYADDIGDGQTVPQDVKDSLKLKKNPFTGEQYDKEPIVSDGLPSVNWASLKGKGADAINYVIPYLQESAWPANFETLVDRPSFSQIVYYNLQSGGSIFGGGQSSNTLYGAPLPIQFNVVHGERVMHIADSLLSNNLLGISKIQPIYNDLLDLIRVNGAAAQSFRFNARGGLNLCATQNKIEGYGYQGVSEEEQNKFKDQWEAYLYGKNRLLTTEGFEIKPIEFKTPSQEKQAEEYKQNIAAATGIPARILFGNEAGKLASDEDRKMFDALVSARQNGYCTQKIRLFLDPLIKNKVIPAPSSGSYAVKFPRLQVREDMQESTIFSEVTTALGVLGNSKSADVEMAMPDFITGARKILRLDTSDQSDNDQGDAGDYARPDVSAEDLKEVAANDPGLDS